MATVQDGQNGAAAEQAPVPATAAFVGMKPQLLVEAPKATDAVQFYKNAFGAVEVSRSMQSKRKAEQEQPLISSAQLEIGDSSFLVSDSSADSGKSGVNGFVICLEAEDVEGAVSKAVGAGGVAEGEIVEGEGSGGRVGKVKDPYGFTWIICSPAKKSGDVEA